MATKKRKTPRFLRHRNLVGIEAVLLVAAGKRVLDERVKALPPEQLANWAKVLFVILTTIGMFGAFVLVERVASLGVTKTHEAVQAVPIPVPTLLIHLVAFVGLFYLIAYVQHLPVWPLHGA